MILSALKTMPSLIRRLLRAGDRVWFGQQVLPERADLPAQFRELRIQLPKPFLHALAIRNECL